MLIFFEEETNTTAKFSCKADNLLTAAEAIPELIKSRAPSLSLRRLGH